MKISISSLAFKSEIVAGTFDIHLLQSYGADYLHLDVSDNVACFNVSQAADLILNTHLPVDLHVVSDQPIKLITDIAFEVGVKVMRRKVLHCTLPVESQPSLDDLEFVRTVSHRVGCAITYDTSVTVLEKYVAYINYILIMGAAPGVSGETCRDDAFQRLNFFKQKYPHLQFGLDGGVNEDVLAKLTATPDFIVSGSYVSNSLAPSESVQALRNMSFVKEGCS